MACSWLDAKRAASLAARMFGKAVARKSSTLALPIGLVAFTTTRAGARRVSRLHPVPCRRNRWDAAKSCGPLRAEFRRSALRVLARTRNSRAIWAWKQCRS